MNIELRTNNLADFAALPQPAPHAGAPRGKVALRLQLYACLMLTDALSLLVGCLFGNFVRFGYWHHDAGLSMATMLVPVYIGVALNSRAYSLDVLTSSRTGVVRGVMALMFAVSAILFVSFYLKATADFSRIILTVGTLSGGLVMIVARFAFGSLATRLFGSTPLTEVLIEDGLECESTPGTHVLNAAALGLKPDIDDPLMLDRLGRLLKSADRVVVACRPERRRVWAMALKGANLEAEVLSGELDDLGAIGTGRYGEHATMRVSAGPLGWRDRAFKRVLDLTLVGLSIVILAPIMLAVAIAIKLDSPGPVFFVQKRLGRGNRLFAMYKFRSMRVEACDPRGGRSTSRDDDRITRVGRFIRATSIDELPQLFNVLRGDMSVVGPRPHALGSLAGEKLFWHVDSRYWHRHASKPGLTGLAQIRGFRGATRHQDDLTNRLQADLEYLSGWSIARDLSIILATFRVLIHKNAY